MFLIFKRPITDQNEEKNIYFDKKKKLIKTNEKSNYKN